MNTTTLTRTDVETIDALLDNFKYWDTIGERWTDRHVPNLRHAQRGHWFDADTLRFFGSRNHHIHRAGLLVETRTNAPGGTDWSVTAWTMEDGRPIPCGFGAFGSLAAARLFAERADALWSVFIACHALRRAGCNADTVDLITLTESVYA